VAFYGAEIEGMEELINAFAALGDAAMPGLKKASDVAGAFVLERTKEKVPVRIATLKNSLYLKKRSWRKGQGVTFSTITWGDDVREYAAPVELGHKYKLTTKDGRVISSGEVPPRPFLRPAADESKEKVLSIITDAMNDAIDRMGGRQGF
jgi:HK97 gp10 family phage protein